MDRRVFRTGTLYIAILLAMLLPISAQSAVITVDSELSLDTAADGSCELGEAIRNANANAADTTGGDCATGSVTGVTDLIEFDVVATLPVVISPTVPLPSITDTMTIDATTQDGPVACGGTLNVVLDGSGVPAGNGFLIAGAASQVTIRGFSIIGFAAGAGVLVNGNNSVVECNYIGLGAQGNGVGAVGNLEGVTVTGTGNTVGGPSTADRNAIGNSATSGVLVDGATGTDVLNNFMGVGLDGTAQGNLQHGVMLDNSATFNEIGLDGAGNVISANGSNGVQITGGSNTNSVIGNFIGTDPSGTIAQGNTANGVHVMTSSDSNIIDGNVLSGNQYGVVLETSFNMVTGNLIGTNVAGTAALPNTKSGVFLMDGTTNTIGGGSAGERNIISGNTEDGVLLSGNTNSSNILGNYIGVAADGITAISNGSSGVSVQLLALSTTIGGASLNQGNVISGNTEFGVNIGTAPGTALIQNLIGLGADGTTVVPNGADGVFANFSGTQIGTDPSVPNVISGNSGFGVTIGINGTNAVVLGNLIGSDITGTLDRGNADGGVNIDGAAGVAIGPPGLGKTGDAGAGPDKGFSCPCNWISGNDGPGILAGSNGFGVLLDTNFIGTDINGNPTLPNQGAGVVLKGTSGTLVNNLIAGNNGWGLYAFELAGFTIDMTGNRFQSNVGPGIGIDTDLTISPTSGFNCFSGNGAGIENTGATVTADDNWWGSGDGPGGAGPGNGDTISANVTVNTFLTEPPAGCVVTASAVDALALDVSESVDPVVAGATMSNSVTVTNILGAPVTGIVVTTSRTNPTGVTTTAVTPSAGSYAAPNWTIPNLAVGASATLRFDLAVAPSASAGVSVISLAAAITDVGGSLGDADADVELTSIARRADLSVTKTSVPDAVMPGAPVSYTITASNLGPSNAPNSRVMDTFPSELEDVSWSCSGTGGATCPATGAGNINLTVNMPAGSALTIVATATVPPGAGSGIVNTAVVVAPPGVTDPDPSNNSAGTGTPVVEPLALAPLDTVLPGARVGEPYEFFFAADGGLAPLALQGSDAPPGLAFTKLIRVATASAQASTDHSHLLGDGAEANPIAADRPGLPKGDTSVSLLLSGVPTQAGDFTPIVSVSDAATPAQMIERGYALTVNDTADEGSQLPLAVVGASYGAQLNTDTLPSPVSWTLSAGNLPPGLVLNGTGLVNGIPQQAGVFPFNAAATGANQSTEDREFSITVFEEGLVSLTTSLPNALADASYSAPVLVSGGASPYTCALVSGALPPGLAIEGCASSIRGTPGSAGTFDFTVRATDNSTPPFGLDIGLRIAVAADTPIPAGKPPVLEQIANPEDVPDSGRGSPGLALPDESLQHVAVDAFGNQYFTGYAWSGFSYDMLIFKYDSLDRRVWQQKYDSGGQDYGYGIAINPVDQGVYISGYLLNGTVFQAVLLKYDLNGVLEWERRTSPGQLLDAWYALAADRSGVYAVGERYNGLNFDALFNKYDHTGNLLWENTRDTLDTESAYALTLLDCDPGDAGPCRVYTAGAEGVNPRGGWVAELNPNTGAILQDNGIDNSARVLALMSDLNGNLIAGATDDLTADWRLFNLDTGLMTNWQTTYAAGDILRSLAVDRENFIYAGGGTQTAPVDALIVVFGEDGMVLDELVIDNGQNEGINGVAIDPANRLVANGQRSGASGVTFLIFRIYTGKAF